MAEKKKKKPHKPGVFTGGINPRLVMRYPKPKPKPKRKPEPKPKPRPKRKAY